MLVVRLLVVFAFRQPILPVVINPPDLKGGTQGPVRVPTPDLPGHNHLRYYRLGYYYVVWACLVLT